MRAISGSVVVLCTLQALFASGCGDDDDDGVAGSDGTEADAGTGGGDTDSGGDNDGTDAGNGTAGTDAGAFGGASTTVSLSGATAGGGISSGTISGIEVCVHDHPEIDCVITDENGQYVLAGLPRNSELTITYSSDDYEKIALPILTGTTDLQIDAPGGVINHNRSDITPQDMGLDADFEFQDDLGTIWFGVFPSLSGATVTISPEAGDGPFYSDDIAHYDTTATATTDEGTGRFHNLPPGEYELSVTVADYSCGRVTGSPFWGHEGTGSSVRVLVLAGHQTLLGSVCSPTN